MQRSWTRWTFGLTLAVAIMVAVSPYLWTLVTSFKTERELFTVPITYLPKEPTLDNYRTVFTDNPFGRFLFNSALVASISTAITLLLASLAGYAFSRLRFRGQTAALFFVLGLSALPIMSMIVPLYMIIQGLGLLNRYQGLIAPYVTWSLPLAIFILANFFRQIPRELEESALIDGATWLGALRYVIAPLSGPGLASAAVIVFVHVWNEFLIGLTLVSSVHMRTITVGIALYQSEYAFPWGTITAAVTLAALPIVLLLLVGQRFVTSGLTSGALKG